MKKVLESFSILGVIFCMTFAMIALTPGQSAAAPTKHVNASAAPGGNGTSKSPFQTIQEGIASLPPNGGTVLVQPGTYLGLEATFDRFPRLRERRVQLARTMSGGEQQMLAIGRALMAKPRLLLMDEPSMGLAPIVVEEIARIIEEISAQGVPVVLVEQNAELALDLADYAYVLENGDLALEGPANQLHDNEHVRAAYLGV